MHLKTGRTTCRGTTIPRSGSPRSTGSHRAGKQFISLSRSLRRSRMQIDDLTTDAQPGPEAGLLAGGCAPAAPPSAEERSLDRAAPRNPQKRVCHVCGKEFSRNDDLRHHLLHAHRTGAPPPSFECPLCFKSFRKTKDMLVHVRMQRCHSKRGRQYVAISAT